ncbi:MULTISPECIES: hypothetical protein [unclassified Crossiella]|uniref:hypothetical protein n=1 Tax=unclassified Crossiella TaxID=2620835 RepID=UPI001FFE4056|nr:MULTISPECIES: hypothetical protein [unclassified Crossiella]MCK2240944.1 hypothetical protein [Crossiella sp. S99.2]MCK2253912.1 hypothetical protein [Crossiella sp. S99.1]
MCTCITPNTFYGRHFAPLRIGSNGRLAGFFWIIRRLSRCSPPSMHAITADREAACRVSAILRPRALALTEAEVFTRLTPDRVCSLPACRVPFNAACTQTGLASRSPGEQR